MWLTVCVNLEEEPNSVRIQMRTLMNARLLLHALKSEKMYEDKQYIRHGCDDWDRNAQSFSNCTRQNIANKLGWNWRRTEGKLPVRYRMCWLQIAVWYFTGISPHKTFFISLVQLLKKNLSCLTLETTIPTLCLTLLCCWLFHVHLLQHQEISS